MLKLSPSPKTRIVDEVEDVICDLCGESCRIPIGQDRENRPIYNFHGALGFDITGCYGATFPPDMENWEIDICQFCFAWIISHCRTAPRRMEIGILRLGGGGSRDDLVDAEGPPVYLDALLTGDSSLLPEEARKDYDRAMNRDAMLVEHSMRRKDDDPK